MPFFVRIPQKTLIIAIKTVFISVFYAFNAINVDKISAAFADDFYLYKVLNGKL
jgi:hypothetical protein